MQESTKQDLLAVRLTTEQKKQVLKNAKDLGFTLSDFIRYQLLINLPTK